MLGTEIGQPPGLRGDDAEILAAGQRRAVGQHQLHMLAQDRRGESSLAARQRMPIRGNGNQLHHADRALFERIHAPRQRAADTHARHAIEHELRHRAQRLDIKAKANCGEFGAEGIERLDQHAGRQHDIDSDGDLRLQAADQSTGAGEQPIHALRDPARIGEDRAAGFGQFGPAGRLALEQGEAELAFEIGDGVADHRGGTAQSPGSTGETAGFSDCQEGLEMVEAGRTRIHCSTYLNKSFDIILLFGTSVTA